MLLVGRTHEGVSRAPRKLQIAGGRELAVVRSFVYCRIHQSSPLFTARTPKNTKKNYKVDDESYLGGKV